MKVVFFRSGMSGGTATLSFRVGSGFKKLGFDIYYFFSELNDNNNYEMFKTAGFVVDNQKKIKNYINRDDSLMVFVYSLEEHVMALNRFKHYSNCIIFLYPVSNTISGSEPKKIEKIRIIGKAITRRYFNSVLNSKTIVFPGEDIKSNYLNYYKTTNEEAIVLRIPIVVAPFNESKIKKRFDSKQKTFVSVLRSEFPLKAYVFPLINSFSRLSKKNGSRLLLVVSGDNVSMVENEIIKNNAQQTITVLSGCSYNEVLRLLDDAFLNIGHGGIVLDASSLGVPTIVSVEFSYDNNCCGFFGTYPALTGKSNMANFSFQDMLNQTLLFNYDEYFSICKNAYDYVCSAYSMDSFVESILNLTKKISFDKKKIMFKNIYYLKVIIDQQIKKILGRSRK